MHFKQLEGSVSCQQFLWGWFVGGDRVPSALRLSFGEQRLHQLQLSNGDVWQGDDRHFGQLSLVSPRGFLYRGGATMFMLILIVIKRNKCRNIECILGAVYFFLLFCFHSSAPGTNVAAPKSWFVPQIPTPLGMALLRWMIVCVILGSF
jgi:hypothetical protein